MKQVLGRRGLHLLGSLLLMVISTIEAQAAGVKIQGLEDPDRVPGQYIVVLKDQPKANGMLSPMEVQESRIATLGKVETRLLSLGGIGIQRRFEKLIPALVIQASEEQVSELAQDEAVAFIEADRYVRVNEIQESATWGIDRVDSRKGQDGSYQYSATGEGVHAYIIDTGVFGGHDEFAGRVGEGFSSVEDGRGSEDCHGHGTHVSGTVGGSVYGVAKDVIIHGVRVLSCNGTGTNSGVIAGVEWVAENAIKPAVANMSLGGGVSEALDSAVEAAVEAGIVFVVAAGNESSNACNGSPSRVPAAITVGSTDKSDRRSSFSNYGSCVDIFAPGTQITSASTRSPSATATFSGTSMASPHVAGAVALILQQDHTASPAKVEEILMGNASEGAISNVGNGSPNMMLFTNPEGIDRPDPEPCEDCTFTDSLAGSGDYLILGQEYYRDFDVAATLIGPEGTDFDLYLQKRHWFWGWKTVKSSISSTSIETISYVGAAGRYRWLVKSESGAGDFTLDIQ